MKPSLPKGTRDFSPADMARRNYVLEVIRREYELFGFRQIETPAMENLSVLEGKYGEEGDRLLYRILNSGPVLEDLKKNATTFTAADITEKGLRYDLTVPFARYVVMHQHEITFPFRRYQVQPVWRADRPQKGRYREFVQCDADVIGSDSLLNEAELIQIVDRVFRQLGVAVSIRVNNRKILSGISSHIDARDRVTEMTVAIDKLEKIGIEKVNEELAVRGFSPEAIARLHPVIGLSGSNEEKLAKLGKLLESDADGKRGLEEAAEVFRLAEGNVRPGSVCLDLTLARGLNYYTGTILEIKADDPRTTFTGSLCGGGRYDDLTGIFGLPGVSGVGISFGIDRICDVMEEMKLLDEKAISTTRVLFVNFGGAEEKHALGLLQQLRAKGIPSEIYPDVVKMKKQMSYANANAIPFVALAGSEEIKSGMITVKNMKSGEQEKLDLAALAEKLK